MIDLEPLNYRFGPRIIEFCLKIIDLGLTLLILGSPAGRISPLQDYRFSHFIIDFGGPILTLFLEGPGRESR